MEEKDLIRLLDIHEELGLCISILKNKNVSQIVKKKLKVKTPEEFVAENINEFKMFAGSTAAEIIKKNAKNIDFISAYNKLWIRLG